MSASNRGKRQAFLQGWIEGTVLAYIVVGGIALGWWLA